MVIRKKEVNGWHEPQKNSDFHGGAWTMAGSSIGGEEDSPAPQLPGAWEDKHLSRDNTAARKVSQGRVQPANADSASLSKVWVVRIHFESSKQKLEISGGMQTVQSRIGSMSVSQIKFLTSVLYYMLYAWCLSILFNIWDIKAGEAQWLG